MTDATMLHPEFNPGRSPLLAVAAVFATALTIGVAVLLPGQPAIPEGVTAIAAAQPVVAAAQPAIDAIRPVAAQIEEVQAMRQLVTLPPVEIVGTRPTTKAAANRWNVPAVYNKKS